MRYTGYSEKELNEIIAILEKNGVPYEVSADEEGIDAVEKTLKDPFYHQQRRPMIDVSFYALTIDQDKLKALPGKELLLLQELRVYPEMDTVYTQEEIVTNPNLRRRGEVVKKAERILSIIALLIFAILGLFWIDDYVYPIFGALKGIEWV